MASQYPLLRFTANVDWKDVNPALLMSLSRLAAEKHTIIDVFSGYRSDAYSAAHGGFAGDPHTQGIAVDANVDGKPIGQVFTAQDFKQAGLITGNQPNFYKGKPDPEHVQLASGAAAPSTGAPVPSAPSPVAAPQSTPQDYTDTATATMPDPSSTQAQVYAPGTNVSNPYELWQRVVQASSSPDPQTLAYANLAGG